MDACGAFSSSSSPSLSTLKKYDVFISFRGEDTRNNFTSHLYAALCRKRINTYMDKESLQIGDKISPTLLQAIGNSEISIIVFSKGYASSSWCLNELIHILECHRDNKQMVIPIFYEVDPVHIRKQEGSYGEAFLEHQKHFKDKPEIVQGWRTALTESADLSGWDSRATGPESELVNKVVEDVLRKLSSSVPLISDGFRGLIGMEERCEEVEKLFSTGSPNVRIIGLWGIGGIGKTTLANAIYSRILSQFQSCCFLQNVREKSEKHNGLEKLRKNLFAELIGGKKVDLGTPYSFDNVKRRLKDKRVLIVLDDVSESKQLEYLIGHGDLLGSGSRILLTTRYQEVLRTIDLADGIERCPYEVEQLNYEETLELFNLTVFDKRIPPTSDFTELSKEMVYYVGGNPLAIKVLGSLLCSLSKENWKRTLKKFTKFPSADTHNVLKISYDGLEKDEKNVFLDIACFFKGERRDFVENILNGCGLFASNGIDILIDKFLVTIDQRGQLQMHDMVQEMGQEIVRRESANPGERSRLWKAEDIFHVLQNNKGTENVQGMFLDLSTIDKKMNLEPTIFRRMHNLRLLKIYDSSKVKKDKVRLQDLQYLPRSLRYLKWHGYPLKSLPSKFKPVNLIELKMPNSQLEQLWDGVQDLNKLRSIDLRYSVHLSQIPDLSLAPNLESINLKRCVSLDQVHFPNLQNLKKLTFGNLSYDCELHGHLCRIFDVASHRTLSIQSCSNLNTLAMIIATSLVSLDISSSSIEYLPSSIGSLINLSKFYLNYCTRLANIPSSMNKLDSLKYLILSGCSVLENFPELPWKIEILDISGTAIKEVASSSIEGCFRLWRINLSDCKSLESLPSNISRLRSLAYLHLGGCSKLKKLPEILEPMESLDTLDLSRTGIRQLPSSIGNLIRLRYINMDECKNLESIPSSIAALDMLLELNLSNCPKLGYFPMLFSFLPSILEYLDLSNSNIKEIPESVIERIFMLRRLYIRNCKNLRSLPELPLSLEILDASGCVSLEVVLNSRRSLTQEFWIDYHIPHRTYEHLIFGDCMKLDEKERDNIVIDFQLRVLRMATIYVNPRSLQLFNPTVDACLPGNEIPKLFEYQCEGSSINIKLPPQWPTTSFLGFVVCAVGNPYSGATRLKLICGLNLKQRGVFPAFASEFADWYDEYWELPSKSKSSHLYMSYEHRDYRKCLIAKEASLHFSFKEYDNGHNGWVDSSKCEVKRCGIHILYRQDIEEFGLNFINDLHLELKESDSDAIPYKPKPGASRTSDRDTEEPHPKRIKFFSFL